MVIYVGNTHTFCKVRSPSNFRTFLETYWNNRESSIGATNHHILSNISLKEIVNFGLAVGTTEIAHCQSIQGTAFGDMRN